MHKETTNFEKGLQEAIQWIATHQERFWAITGSVGMVIALFAFMIHHREIENDEAWFQLGAVQGQIMQGKTDEAGKNLEAWNTRFQTSNASTYAKFLKADLMVRTSDYVSAAQIYGELAQTAQPADLRPLALSAQTAEEEMAGHYPQALALAQNFTDHYPDHFLTAPIYISQARLDELTGNPAAASAVYDRFVILYPQSPWTTLAHSRLQALGGTSAPQNPPAKSL